MKKFVLNVLGAACCMGAMCIVLNVTGCNGIKQRDLVTGKPLGEIPKDEQLADYINAEVPECITTAMRHQAKEASFVGKNRDSLKKYYDSAGYYLIRAKTLNDIPLRYWRK